MSWTVEASFDGGRTWTPIAEATFETFADAVGAALFLDSIGGGDVRHRPAAKEADPS